MLGFTARFWHGWEPRTFGLGQWWSVAFWALFSVWSVYYLPEIIGRHNAALVLWDMAWLVVSPVMAVANARALWTDGVVFRQLPPDQEPFPLRVPKNAPPITLSGLFHLPEKLSLFLRCIPSKFARDTNGDVVFLANIDASSTVYGFRVVDRRGTYECRLAIGRYQILGHGLQYWGLHARPAIQVRVLDARNYAYNAVISCTSTELLRDIVAQVAPYQGQLVNPKG